MRKSANRSAHESSLFGQYSFPYRVDFFGELGKFCELTVLFEREKASDRQAGWQSQGTNGYQTHYLKGIKVKTETAFAPGVLRFLKKNQFDIIVIGGYATPTAMLSILWLKIRKIPFILNADGGFIKPSSGFKDKVKRFFIGAADAWICSGAHTKEYFVHYGAQAARCFVYPFSSLMQGDILQAPPTSSQKQSVKTTLNIPEPKAALAVGQFIPRKGFDILLKAWQNMPQNFGLFIIGDNPSDEYLNLVDELKLQNVHFVGFLSKTALKQYYLACDLFVLPTREDIWGLVVNEAMAAGLPVLTTTACLAGLELINESNGRLTAPEDIKATHDAIVEMLSSSKKTSAMPQHALETIQPYTIENMAKHHIEIFKTILK